MPNLTIKIPDDLQTEMQEVREKSSINWSIYIRNAVKDKISEEKKNLEFRK